MKIFLKICKWLAVIVIIIVIIDAALVFGFSQYRPPIAKSDAIIILGAAINTPALDNRSLEGLRLYQEGKANVIVVSGGRISDEDISEAGYMQKVIKKNETENVPVILEDQSHDTYENIKNSKALIPSAKSVIIVSDDFHLARGVLLALREGFYPVAWSSPKPYYYDKKELAYYYFREMAAMVEYIPKFVRG